MTTQTTPLPSEGFGRRARDFIPESHGGLPMVRILLPLWGERDHPARWSDYVSLDDELASLDWRDVVERHAGARPEIRDLVPCRGEADAATAGALGDAIGDRELTSLRWMGYAGNPFTNDPVRVYGEDFFPAPLRGGDLRVGERIPEFAWDDRGTIAWGTRLYPDSLVLAAEPDCLRRVHADARWDTIPVRPDDVLPWSAGD